MAQGEIIELLKKYIMLLNSEGISVTKAFLYGSYLNNTASETSDIDVMIVSGNFEETDDITAGKIWRLTRKVNSKIEPFIVSIKRFNSDFSSPLVSKIKSEGIEIV